MAQSVFGAGYLWVTGAAFAAPLLVGALQDIATDESQDLKPLYGQLQSPIEQAPGKRKTELKASMGRIDPNLLNQLYFGGSVTTGQNLASNQEISSIPATPYQITVANNSTWSTDLGVFDTVTGKFMTKVGSGATPTTGQYKVTAGVYTFAAADTLHKVAISYTYTSATGYTLASGNPQMGSVLLFQVDCFNSFRGMSWGQRFFACQSSKLSFPGKMDDFTLPSIDLSAQDDGTGRVSERYSTGWT